MRACFGGNAEQDKSGRMKGPGASIEHSTSAQNTDIHNAEDISVGASLMARLESIHVPKTLIRVFCILLISQL